MKQNEFIRTLDDLNEYRTSDGVEAFWLEHHPDWEETTAHCDPPGVRTFQRFVTADIDNEGVVHVREETAAYTDPPGERRHLRFMTAESGEYNVVERGREHLVQFVRELRDGPYVDWTISLIAFTGEYCDQ